MVSQAEIDDFNKKTIDRIDFIVDNIRFIIVYLVLLFDIINQTFSVVPKYYIGELGTTLLIIMSTNFYHYKRYKLLYISSAIVFYSIKFYFFEFNTLWGITLMILIFGDIVFSKNNK